MPSPPALSLEEARAKGEKLMADLRQQGLYPTDGTGTDADVQRLVQAGHLLFAIRLYRELHQVSFEEALRAVKRMK